MTTMKDVARLAGVSVTTVSHVINESRVVNPETRERVLEAVRELDYRPNMLARDLRKKVTKTVAIIVADLDNDYFTELIRVIEEFLGSYGYSCLLCNTDEKSSKEKLYLDIFEQKQVDAMILIPTGKRDELINQLSRISVPIVLIDRRIDGLNIPYVGIQNYNTAYKVLRLFVEAGCRDIDFIGSLPDISAMAEREAGYRAAMQDCGLQVTDEDICYFPDYERETVLRQLEEFYSRRKFPDAFFVASNRLILYVLAFLKSKNLRCPEDVRMIGFGPFKWAEDFQPSISFCKADAYEIGEKAVEILMEKIKEKEGKEFIEMPLCQELPSQIELRGTFGTQEEIEAILEKYKEIPVNKS